MMQSGDSKFLTNTDGPYDRPSILNRERECFISSKKGDVVKNITDILKDQLIYRVSQTVIENIYKIIQLSCRQEIHVFSIPSRRQSDILNYRLALL